MNSDIKRYLHHVQVDPHLSFYLFDKGWKKIDAQIISNQPSLVKNKGIITYPSGEVLHAFGSISALPSGVHFMIGPTYTDNTPIFNRKKIISPNEVQLFHGISISQQGSPNSHYSTSVKNLTSKKIRVTKFAPLSKNMIGRIVDKGTSYYSALQFKEWFRVHDDDGWIAPNETVRDPDNYGVGNGVWAYFFENEDGNTFIATAPLVRNPVA